MASRHAAGSLSGKGRGVPLTGGIVEPEAVRPGSGIRSGRRRRFCLVLIKPSHYDDDGYVIQWYRSAIPSNSLAVLYGLAKQCAELNALGSDITLEIHGFDETNTRIHLKRIVGLVEGADIGLVMLV